MKVKNVVVFHIIILERAIFQRRWKGEKHQFNLGNDRKHYDLLGENYFVMYHLVYHEGS